MRLIKFDKMINNLNHPLRRSESVKPPTIQTTVGYFQVNIP
jgi:hypothetical protein